jgi:hypothetical protein
MVNAKSIFKLFSPKGKGQAVVHQGVSALIISAVALSLVVLTDYGRIVQASGPGEQPSIEILRMIDPADRKFFNPGYGAMSGVAKEAEVLPVIDPADRKFFTPGYWVDAGGNDLTAYHQSEWSRSPNTLLGVEVLSKIDSADRKFFNSGYGAQP